MDTQVIVRKWADYPIEFEVSSNHIMVNATAMCIALRDDAMNWAYANSTKHYYYAVQEKFNCPNRSLIERRQGRNFAQDDLWIHETLVFKLIEWLEAQPQLWHEQNPRYQDYTPEKLKGKCEKWLAQLLPRGRVKLLRQAHAEIMGDDI